MRAAALTDLDITIPVQPSWSEADIESIRAYGNSSINRGSALAWLGHLNVLDRFLKSNEDTALIMEDDVDWDTRLRTHQIPRTAHAIRELLKSDKGYYGSPGAWDVLWLGHCGDYFGANQGANITSIKTFTDPVMPNLGQLHPWTQGFLQGIGAVQDQQRLVHESVKPLCTFAYAITRSAAETILKESTFGVSRKRTGHGCVAYDVRLLEACRDEGFKCISINPELFHHTDLGSEIAEVSQFDLPESSRSEPESSQEALAESNTANIRCSARSRKWVDLKGKIIESGANPEPILRDLAANPESCYIDDL